MEYLATSSSYFNKDQFKIALKHYLIILDTYPDDVNANFYGGLCYFNLGQFDKTTELLKKSYTFRFGNFREEARWFSARANLEQNYLVKGKYLLNEIIEEGGFYSKKAKVVLGNLEK